MQYKEITLNDMAEFLGSSWTQVTGSASTREYVYDYSIPGHPEVVVRVFTSIHRDSDLARRKGADAIRICAVNLAKQMGWIRTTRVLRVEGWKSNLHRAIQKTIEAATNRCSQMTRALQLATRPVAHTLSAKKTCWSTIDGVWSTEASTLDANKATRPRNLCPQCDGFFYKKDLIKIHQTKDEDQEITHWEFKCPHCKAKLLIFND